MIFGYNVKGTSRASNMTRVPGTQSYCFALSPSVFWKAKRLVRIFRIWNVTPNLRCAGEQQNKKSRRFRSNRLKDIIIKAEWRPQAWERESKCKTCRFKAKTAHAHTHTHPMHSTIDGMSNSQQIANVMCICGFYTLFATAVWIASSEMICECIIAWIIWLVRRVNPRAESVACTTRRKNAHVLSTAARLLYCWLLLYCWYGCRSACI